ncbi:hypothetical protein CGRA01v4_06897 [Colletotrichum graminicola]|nr:hypothetical protein CGRA01v4_06897 [Colletotrichum graminicola]
MTLPPLAVRGATPGRACVRGGFLRRLKITSHLIFSSSPPSRVIVGWLVAVYPRGFRRISGSFGTPLPGAKMGVIGRDRSPPLPLSRRLLPLARLRMSIGIRGLSRQMDTQPFALEDGLVHGAARPRRR